MRRVIYSTPRLIVRRFLPTDLEDAFAILSDPEISRYEHWDAFDREQVREDLVLQASVEPDTPEVWNEFAVTLRDGGACIGNISFKRSEPDQGQAEISTSAASGAGAQEGCFVATGEVALLPGQRFFELRAAIEPIFGHASLHPLAHIAAHSLLKMHWIW